MRREGDPGLWRQGSSQELQQRATIRLLWLLHHPQPVAGVTATCGWRKRNRAATLSSQGF